MPRPRSSASVVDELRGGRKRSHWMWFVFPQLLGLGSSRWPRATASHRFTRPRLSTHELLGPRLRECTQLVNQVQHRSIAQIFGSPDNLKLRSSMTLFALAADDNRDFVELLDKYYRGRHRPLTLQNSAG